ncbi:N-acetylmuramic acid 6-phosphate etherase, partial [Cronobacter sakazakii]|nr:N-acetylmuramic acid 6-phosphate etherase [Cronobacter sakazakii]
MNLGSLVSESRNPQTMDLDALSTLEMVTRFNEQDARVAQAVKATLPEVAQAVDAAADALKAGGRIIYMGAGTSGRLGVLDASECPPT